LCAINNISSGNCSEDCGFCTQSAYNKANIQKYKYKDIKQILQEAQFAYASGAVGYCLVTSGKGLDDKTLEFVSKSAKTIKNNFPSLSLIGCNGIATKDQLKQLKSSGIEIYNHNLETSKEYYQNICSTHTWQERLDTVLAAKDIGLKTCVGGIFGLGENKQDRVSFIQTLKDIKPTSVPINFFIPNQALKIKQNILDYNTALKIIKDIKKQLPQSMLMVAGGREYIFENKEQNMFEAGITSIVIGDYLTTKGQAISRDLDIIKKLGLKIAKSCPDSI
jgi:biotin synthase